MSDEERLIEVEHTAGRVDSELTILQTRLLEFERKLKIEETTRQEADAAIRKSLAEENARLKAAIGDIAEALALVDKVYGDEHKIRALGLTEQRGKFIQLIMRFRERVQHAP